LYALRETLQALRQHIFNGVIWPDFTVIPSAAQPALAFVEVKLGQCLEVGGRHIEVLPAVHTVPAVGYAVSAGAGQPAWVYTGDTGPNPALWQRLASMNVHTLVIETAFGDDEQALAHISQHLCPAMLEEELKSLPEGEGAEVLITHIKPGELDAVMREIGAHASPHRIRALVAGERIVITAG
jgi:ribonuclease BN (tRNA processing enzyme)